MEHGKGAYGKVSSKRGFWTGSYNCWHFCRRVKLVYYINLKRGGNIKNFTNIISSISDVNLELIQRMDVMKSKVKKIEEAFKQSQESMAQKKKVFPLADASAENDKERCMSK